MKRNILILLIVLSVAITAFINLTNEPLSGDIRAKVEAELLQDKRFPARPVWWEDGEILAIGVMPDGVDLNKAAADVCPVLKKHGASQTSVEVYDILKIQQEDDWKLIAKASCKS